jgi:hypothetical protein
MKTNLLGNSPIKKISNLFKNDRWNEFLVLLLLSSFKLSCGLMAGKESSGSENAQLPAPYSGSLTAAHAFTFSESGVIASHTVRGGDSKSQKDPKRELFASGGLYKSLTLRCTPCHAGRNDYPFASPGIDLAWITAKKYLADPPENSKFIMQIRSGHNGSQAAWEADFAPLIQALAKP